jgi:hypothetical protein
MIRDEASPVGKLSSCSVSVRRPGCFGSGIERRPGPNPHSAAQSRPVTFPRGAIFGRC